MFRPTAFADAMRSREWLTATWEIGLCRLWSGLCRHYGCSSVANWHGQCAGAATAAVPACNLEFKRGIINFTVEEGNKIGSKLFNLAKVVAGQE